MGSQARACSSTAGRGQGCVVLALHPAGAVGPVHLGRHVTWGNKVCNACMASFACIANTP